MQNWLAYISSLHPQKMDLGLERVQKVAEQLQLLNPSCPVIMVGGTNGKGSCVATLSAIYLSAGFRVGTFTSPYLFNFNEQVKINDQAVTDEYLCLAFAEVEAARGEVRLTSFEFTTLAALWLFKQQALDVIILEVGLGGRLDAVNIITADVAIITSIDLDHCEWLGNTREQIAYEKAGIFKPGKLAISGDLQPPITLQQIAQQINCKLLQLGCDFHYHNFSKHWQWCYQDIIIDQLPHNSLLIQNMACALMAIHLLQSSLPVPNKNIIAGITNIYLPGRLEKISAKVPMIVDVAHNPAAVGVLLQYLINQPVIGKNIAVFSMLADKDIASCCHLLREQIDSWHVFALNIDRGANLETLRHVFDETHINMAVYHKSLTSAFLGALSEAQVNDRIIIFGSFHVVAGVKKILQSESNTTDKS